MYLQLILALVELVDPEAPLKNHAQCWRTTANWSNTKRLLDDVKAMDYYLAWEILVGVECYQVYLSKMKSVLGCWISLLQPEKSFLLIQGDSYESKSNRLDRDGQARKDIQPSAKQVSYVLQKLDNFLKVSKTRQVKLLQLGEFANAHGETSKFVPW